jgi:hypothetical protein
MRESVRAASSRVTNHLAIFRNKESGRGSTVLDSVSM